MSELPDGKCGYTWPEDHETGDDPKHQNCCYRDAVEEVGKCVWHAKSETTNGNTIKDLKESQVNSEIRKQTHPVGELIDGAKLSGVDLQDSVLLRRVTLRNADLTGANLRGADLTDTNFRDADLSNADLRSAELIDVNLRYAHLADADLRYANLIDGDLVNASLPGVSLYKTDLSGADLSNANLTGANLSGSDLTETSLHDADLSEVDLDGADLSETDFLEPDLADEDFSDADLSGVDLRGANLARTNFRGANLTGANFRDANLTRAEFRDSDLVTTNFRLANLSRADLSKANLTDANLGIADLSRADLSKANLTDANLSGANLLRAGLSDADLTNANLRGTELSNANLQNTDLSNVAVDGSTSCKQLYERDNFFPSAWDATARAYHDLKSVFASHGLIGKARNYHVRERRARRLETKDTNERYSREYLGNLTSAVFTGYGVRPSRLGVWMIGLFALSTGIYWEAGVQNNLISTLSYSLVTFTTTPPHRPDGVFLQTVVMTEAFLGTLSLITLGYIFSNRERF